MAKKKLPKNLEKAMEEKSVLSDFTFEHLYDSEYDPYAGDIKDWKALYESLDYRAHEAVHSLIHEAAKEFLGFSHTSDILDDSPDSEFNKWAGSRDTSYDEESSSEEEESTTSRWDQYDDVKDNFKSKLDESLGSNSLTSLGSFSELYKIAQEMGFGGSTGELESILKNSTSFRSVAKDRTTRYTG